MTSSVVNFTNNVKIKDSKNQPLDSVSIIVNDPARVHQQGFYIGGWDGIIRSYSIRPRTIQQIQLNYARQLNHPIISACCNSSGVVFAGLANGDIIAVDTHNDCAQKIGGHEAPICKLFYIQNFNMVFSFGFDLILRIWNLSADNGNFLACQFNLPSKTHCAAYDFPYIMVSTIQGKGYFLDLSLLPNNLPIPDYNKLFDIMQAGSKIQSMRIIQRQKLYVLGCIDGRVNLGQFIKDYQGIRIIESSKRMLSKSMKRQSSYSSNPSYGQVNEVDIGLIKEDYYLIVAGTEQASFYNINKKDKARRIKQKCTAGHLSIDGRYYIYAVGNDWNEGIFDLKNPKRPEVLAVKFTQSQVEAFIKKV